MHRYVFHIPCAVYENGALKSAPWQQVIDEFAEVLYKHTDGFFVQDAVGYYKGRSYAEKLLVAYTAADVADECVLPAFCSRNAMPTSVMESFLSRSDACTFNGLRFYAASVRGNSCCRQ